MKGGTSRLVVVMVHTQVTMDPLYMVALLVAEPDQVVHKHPDTSVQEDRAYILGVLDYTPLQ